MKEKKNPHSVKVRPADELILSNSKWKMPLIRCGGMRKKRGENKERNHNKSSQSSRVKFEQKF